MRHVVEGAVGRKPDTDLFFPNGVTALPDHLEHEAAAVLDTAAVFVIAAIGVRVDELLEQVAVCRVDLDAVTPGLDSIFPGLYILFCRGADILESHCARRRVRLHAIGIGVHLARQFDGGGCDDLGPFGQIGFMDDPPAMHELDEEVAALVVDGFRDLVPAFNLRLAVDTWNARVADAVG